MCLLAKGLNFSITSKTLPNKDTIATTENAVKDFEKKRLTRFLAQIQSKPYASKLKPPKDNLSKDECKA